MKIAFTVILMMIMTAGFSQSTQLTKAQKDSLMRADSITFNAKVFSAKDIVEYINSINETAAAVKKLELSKDEQYTQMVKEMNRILIEVDKRRKER